MNLKTERLIEWARGRPQPPVTIELIPTDRCNFSCRSCWRQGVSAGDLQKRYSEEMSDERLMGLVDEAAELGVREIALVGGGEPLSREITFELMMRIRKRGMDGDIVTNGSLLTEEMMRGLVKSRWTMVKFSIDGSVARIQDDLRGAKCYNMVLANIRRLAGLKKAMGSDRPRIGFNTVVSNRNYKDLPNIIEIGRSVGCNELHILPLTVFSKEGERLKMDIDQMAEFQGIIRKCLPILRKHEIWSNLERFLDLRYVEKTGSMHEVLMEEAEKTEIRKRIERGERLIEDESEDPLENFMTVPCFEPWSHVTIIGNGNIAACFNNYVWETKVNIKNHTLKELWHGEYFDQYRRQILTRRLPEACATCCVWRVFEVQAIKKEMEEHAGRR
ncbi:MAG: radical SAM protein [archaeon]